MYSFERYKTNFLPNDDEENIGSELNWSQVTTAEKSMDAKDEPRTDDIQKWMEEENNQFLIDDDAWSRKLWPKKIAAMGMTEEK